MEIVLGWVVVALYVVLCRFTMGGGYAWFVGFLIAWAEGREFFGERALGAFGLAVALTVALIGWGRNFLRWMHRHRSPLLIGQRGADPAASPR